MAFWLTALAFAISLLAFLLAPRSGRLCHLCARAWSWLLLGASGVCVRLEGAEHLAPKESRLLVANHGSYLDPPALMIAFPGSPRFVMKRELLKLPFIGWYSYLAGHFLIDRSRARQGAALLEEAVARAHALRLSPVVFPEGTRTRDGRLGPFKAGAFELSVAGNLPVQPIAVFGAHELMPPNALAPRRSGDIVIRVAPVLATSAAQGSAARRELSEQARQAMLSLGVRAVG